MIDRFNKSYLQIEAMPVGTEKAIQYLVCGLLTDGDHHKQWCLEQALHNLGVTTEELRTALAPEYDFEEGIAP